MPRAPFAAVQAVATIAAMTTTPRQVALELSACAKLLLECVTVTEREDRASLPWTEARARIETEIVAMKKAMQRLRAAVDGQDPDGPGSKPHG